MGLAGLKVSRKLAFVSVCAVLCWLLAVGMGVGVGAGLLFCVVCAFAACVWFVVVICLAC